MTNDLDTTSSPGRDGWFITLVDMSAITYAGDCFKKTNDMLQDEGGHDAAKGVLRAWIKDIEEHVGNDWSFDEPFRFIAWNVLETFILWLDSTAALIEIVMEMAGDRGLTGFLTRLENDNSHLQYICEFAVIQFRDAGYTFLADEIERVAGLFQRDIELRLSR